MHENDRPVGTSEEDELLRTVALQTASSIRRARQRAEEELMLRLAPERIKSAVSVSRSTIRRKRARRPARLQSQKREHRRKNLPMNSAFPSGN